MNQRVLVTGATGFVGRTLNQVLLDSGYRVRATVRQAGSSLPATIEQVAIGDIGANTDWSEALRGVDAVVHAAARAHIMNAKPSDFDLYYETNARGTARLAQAAAHAGVQRFVYVSSIKVNGEERPVGAYTATDTPNPQDPYGKSKWEGEQALLAIGGPMQAAVVRPPLVYGPGVRANFLRLMRWVDREVPLPLGSIENRRSLVSIWNLCDLLKHLLSSPLPRNQAWLVSDGDDLSTPALIRRIAHAMGRRARLWPVPVAALQLAGTLTGKSAEISRLRGSLAVDIAATRQSLGWSPPVSVDDALLRTVKWYLSEARTRAD
jgi:nucleoside-diphosphate-sugar epimerase